MPIPNEQQTRKRVRELVLELAPNPEKGDQDEVLLVEDLEYHSLALLELAFALEDEFDLPPIDEQSVQNIRTAADIENHVVRQLESKDAEPLAATTE
ncbi:MULTISPECIES: phosphopantetheine-binding protein [Micromonospora]|uniref:phosphopantetheine-binding protein n=1 Tax=Micromonospora TaxID=1873 RepID=UPI001C223F74|nr:MULTISPECIES: phosphopantetheine-binding protein [unclassified Micromonospora]MBU8860451.1 acyl carrier protein [Micromonospora sp. WMMB482]MDM4779988.1 phosphopantetheine-binding protein [Micromonospora sp. b486]MDW3849359.1 phosphopantetheine-binding protein [Micromonospora sp. BRA006-A]WBC05563.1 phosphopantetheine-binding protein [Micromonospora sp. WMMA1976]